MHNDNPRAFQKYSDLSEKCGPADELEVQEKSQLPRIPNVKTFCLTITIPSGYDTINLQLKHEP